MWKTNKVHTRKEVKLYVVNCENFSQNLNI